jgi:hypothetical protein
MADLPIVCSLGPDALAARRAGLLADLWNSAQERHAWHEGFRLRFGGDGDSFAAIARAVNAERQCCRFLRFQISVEPDGGPISVELTGPPGTGEFLSALVEQ